MKYKVIFLLLLFLVLTPAWQSEKADDAQLIRVYDDFLNRIRQEKLPAEIEKRVVENLERSTVFEPETIDYSIQKTNLFSREENDIILQVNHSYKYKWQGINKNQFYVFQRQANDTYTEKRYEEHKWMEYEIAELTGDGKVELILITNDSGNGYTYEPVQILSCHSGEIAVIFEEILCAYGYLPFKQVQGNHFYKISFDNDYEFVPNRNGTKDILFSSKIFEREDEIMLEGQTRFVFQQTNYLPDGEYFDYRKTAETIYKEKE